MYGRPKSDTARFPGAGNATQTAQSGPGGPARSRPPRSSRATAPAAGGLRRGLRVVASCASLACFEVALAAQAGMQRPEPPSGPLHEAKFSRALAWCSLSCNLQLKVSPKLNSGLLDTAYSTVSGLQNYAPQHPESRSERACSPRSRSRPQTAQNAKVPV